MEKKNWSQVGRVRRSGSRAVAEGDVSDSRVRPYAVWLLDVNTDINHASTAGLASGDHTKCPS